MITVGVDGSQASRAALRWAGARTGRLGPIEPVSAYSMPWWALLTTPALATSHPERTLRDAASALTERALADLDPSVPCLTARIRRGSAGRILVRAAEDSGMLVVGSRGRNPLVATALGSVSTYCVGHATVPVVVVPQDVESTALKALVVGVDGTDPSEAALEWALRHADAGATVSVVNVWQYTGPVHADEWQDRKKFLTAQAWPRVDEVLDQAIQAVDRDDVSIEKVIEFGDPASELAKLAASADALVVGRRTRKGLDRLLSDSVTVSVSHHLRGVLVVVPSAP